MFKFYCNFCRFVICLIWFNIDLRNGRVISRWRPFETVSCDLEKHNISLLYNLYLSILRVIPISRPQSSENITLKRNLRPLVNSLSAAIYRMRQDRFQTPKVINVLTSIQETKERKGVRRTEQSKTAGNKQPTRVAER